MHIPRKGGRRDRGRTFSAVPLYIRRTRKCKAGGRRIRLTHTVRGVWFSSAGSAEEREAEHITRSFLFHASRKLEWFFFLLRPEYSPHRIPALNAGDSSEGQCPLPSGLRDQGEKAKSGVK
ncbi:uncharacterized protein MONOS_7364 [Monocercomonoides exilis]|uniref:uncharacterized protein n=1 Tax=Monocercomonoides exilis TaxID=2049356 RepID=UPI00355A6D9B|nr:hypothetical protein MONOS_7364 [Monocercomonoides exilis]|eukprot:MONOS_7364.1-p1 / transcript=MONOS_7364.1 / gene=MONOS_7364 / organism=Monocercomonoides_exilis_PA203 / gene_product=unspecified product / transcript_product=unspecified product / location=Mono_scaffold00249:68360-69076(+) / protein_length=121 / sequence_SO=supercontig / SO=protein_coding / is_pseudo=false